MDRRIAYERKQILERILLNVSAEEFLLLTDDPRPIREIIDMDKMLIKLRWTDELLRSFGLKLENGVIVDSASIYEMRYQLEEFNYYVNVINKTISLTHDDTYGYIYGLRQYIIQYNEMEKTPEEFRRYVDAVNENQNNFPIPIFDYNWENMEITMDHLLLREEPICCLLAYLALDNGRWEGFPRLPDFFDLIDDREPEVEENEEDEENEDQEDEENEDQEDEENEDQEDEESHVEDV